MHCKFLRLLCNRYSMCACTAQHRGMLDTESGPPYLRHHTCGRCVCREGPRGVPVYCESDRPIADRPTSSLFPSLAFGQIGILISNYCVENAIIASNR